MSPLEVFNAGTLRGLPLSARLGLSALLLVLCGGFLASGAHLIAQHENRDERGGVSMTDLEGAYHGVENTSPLLTAIRGGHPEQLVAAERNVLLHWLEGKRVSEDYDSLELGADAPAEILARRCVECHSKAGLDGAHADARFALSTWSDVSKLAFTKRIEALPTRVLVASTHAHALALAPLSVLLALLVFATRFGARFGGSLCLAAGAALLCDLGSWWLARSFGNFTLVIAASGSVYALATGVSLVLVFVDLWAQKRAR